MVPVRSRTSAGKGVADDEDTVVRPLAPPEVETSSSVEEAESGGAVRDEQGDKGDVQLLHAVGKLINEVQTLRKNRAFPSLEELEAISRKRETYLGPTMESNWVLPGKLLVGAYPASMNDSHHAHILCTILLQGVSTFVCLQQEYRSDGVTEAMWRSGEALRPYYQDVIQLLRKLQELKVADPGSLPAICSPQDTDFVHFPIVDCNVADDTKVLQLALKLATRVARGEVLYLHCWGGHGRTGTVVSIMLHLMFGLSADEAMRRCQHVHDVRRIPISVGSPQTDAQRQQVRRVVSHLLHRRPCPPLSPNTKSNASEVASENPMASEGAIGSKSDTSPEGKNSSGARASATTGGRRGWVRGKRQALAQAPNGVGENFSGWVSGGDADGENENEGEAEGEHQEKRTGGKAAQVDGDCDGVRASCARSSASPPSQQKVVPQSTVTDGTEMSTPASTLVSATTTSMPRRKSFTEPYSEDDPCRGTRNHRLRRKSTPAKSPAHKVLMERAGTVGGCKGKEDMPGAVSAADSGAVSIHETVGDSSKGEVDITASPGSCTGVDRCATRSGTGGVTSAGHTSPCRGSRLGR